MQTASLTLIITKTMLLPSLTSFRMHPLSIRLIPHNPEQTFVAQHLHIAHHQDRMHNKFQEPTPQTGSAKQARNPAGCSETQLYASSYPKFSILRSRPYTTPPPNRLASGLSYALQCPHSIFICPTNFSFQHPNNCVVLHIPYSTESFFRR